MSSQSRSRPFLAALAVLGLLAAGTTAVMRVLDDGAPPALPADPSRSPVTVVAAWPFTLDVPAIHWSRAEQPRYDAGMILVLAADPDVLHPRQSEEAVLYVGAQTAEKLNTGHPSGHVVVLVPAPRDGRGGVDLDLASSPVFFGTPALPETIDGARAAAELAAARAQGVTSESSAALASRVHGLVSFVDDGDLRTWSADLIERWSPQERDLVSGLRAPRLRR